MLIIEVIQNYTQRFIQNWILLVRNINKYVKGVDAIDYGCGAGKSSLYLKSLGFNVMGVDANKDMIESAKDKDPCGNYDHITSAKILVKDSSFDLAFSSWVLMEVASKKELLNIAKEIERILRPGGVFILILCNESTYNSDWLTQNTEFPENKNLESGSVVKILFKDIDLTISDYYWTERDYSEMLDKAGLKLLEIYMPLGKKDDGYDWINEDKRSSCSIYIASKPSLAAG